MQGVYDALLKFSLLESKHSSGSPAAQWRYDFEGNQSGFRWKLQKEFRAGEGNRGQGLPWGTHLPCSPHKERQLSGWFCAPSLQGWHTLLNGTNTPTEQPSCMAVPPKVGTPEPGIAPCPDSWVARHQLWGDTVRIEIFAVNLPFLN